MQESNKYNETESCVVYKKTAPGFEQSMIFDKELKTVDVTQSIFIRNDEPMLEPMESEWIRYSAKYGHWQSIHPTLGREDVEFMHRKYIQLFGDKEEVSWED